jgi:hypothetical protein
MAYLKRVNLQCNPQRRQLRACYILMVSALVEHKESSDYLQIH